MAFRVFKILIWDAAYDIISGQRVERPMQ